MRGYLRHMTERDILIPVMLLLLGFGTFFSRYAAMVLLYCALFPAAFASMGRELPKTNGRRDRTPLAALVCCCVLAALLLLNDMRGGDWKNVVSLTVPFLVCLLVLLQPPAEFSVKDVRRGTERFGAGLILLFLPLELLGLYCLFSDRVITLPLADGVIGVEHFGTLWDRLQILSHPNNVGQYAVFSLVFCLYFFRRLKKPALRAGLALAMAVHVVILAHVQSRNDTTAAALSVMLFVFFTGRESKRLSRKRGGTAAAALLAAAAGILLYLVIEWVYKLDMSCLRGMSVRDISTRSDTYGALDVVSTGRGAIWKWALGYFRAHPAKLLTGIGSDYYRIISSEFPIADTFRSLHSSFLSCLVLGGIPLLGCVAWLMLTLIHPVLTMLFTAERTEYRDLVIVPILICALFGMSLIESMLYINPYVNPCFQNLMFFTLCGYARAFEREHPCKGRKE